MKAKQKYKFKNKVWIVGFYDGHQVIGRTFCYNEENRIVLITARAETIVIDFEEIERVKILSFPIPLPMVTTSYQNKKKKTVSEQLILDTLMLINKQ